MIKNLQKYEDLGSFFIEDPAKDLKQSKKVVTTWVSRSLKGYNLVGKKPSSDLVKLNDRYVLGFKKNKYVSDITVLSNEPGNCAFLCITFRVLGGEENQVLISNYEDIENDYCEIKVSSEEIYLDLHKAVKTIQHSCKEWTTLFLQCYSDESSTYYKYSVNGVTGSFSGPASDLFITDNIAVGSRLDDSYFLNGQVAALEFYQVQNSSEIPEYLQRIVIKNQTIVS